MKREKFSPELLGIRLAKAAMGFLTLAAIMLFTSEVGVCQGDSHKAVVNDLNILAQKAQQYFKTQGNSSLAPSDTGNADGSYSISNDGAAPVGPDYSPGSTAAATSASAQTLYIVGCGKSTGKDGANAIKAYAAVTPDGVTIHVLN